MLFPFLICAVICFSAGSAFELDESDEDFAQEFENISSIQTIPPHEIVEEFNRELAKHPFSEKELPDYDDGYGRTSTSERSLDFEERRKQGLEKINEYRKQHSAPELVLSSELNTKADEYAKNLLQNQALKLESDDKKYGVNTYIRRNSYTDGSTPSPRMENVIVEAIDTWYSESYEYNYESPELSYESSRNYTNMIWKSTEKVGLGVTSEGDVTVVVAVFYPGIGYDVKDCRENVMPKIEEEKEPFFAKHFSLLRSSYF